MKTIGVAFLLSLSITLFAHSEIEDSDSGIHGPKYSEILKTMEKWQAAYPSLTSLEQYGLSVKGKPLKMLVVGKPSASQKEKRPTFIMSGSTHGNEYLNIEDRLPEALLKETQNEGPIKTFIDNGGVFIFIPILNPDGYDARQRENAHGTDLNRDWDVQAANFNGFKEVETRSLVNKISALKQERNLKLEVTVDYHCCAGAILYPWSYTAQPLPKVDLDRHKSIAKFADEQLEIDAGTTGQVLGYYPTGTTKDYYYESHQALAFTYEGRYGKEDKLFDGHVTWWRNMVDFISQEHLLEKLLAVEFFHWI